jgi:hypothetical protein
MRNLILILSCLILASCNIGGTKSEDSSAATTDSLMGPKIITTSSYYEVPAIFETTQGTSDTVVGLIMATSEADALKKAGSYFTSISTSCDVGPAKKSNITVVLPKTK